MPTIEVRFFAAACAETGVESAEWSLAPGATVADALTAHGMSESPVIRRSSFLRNGVAARRDVVLHDGDRLDVLPPFAGG